MNLAKIAPVLFAQTSVQDMVGQLSNEVHHPLVSEFLTRMVMTSILQLSRSGGVLVCEGSDCSV